MRLDSSSSGTLMGKKLDPDKIKVNPSKFARRTGGDCSVEVVGFMECMKVGTNPASHLTLLAGILLLGNLQPCASLRSASCNCQ